MARWWPKWLGEQQWWQQCGWSFYLGRKSILRSWRQYERKSKISHWIVWKLYPYGGEHRHGYQVSIFGAPEHCDSQCEALAYIILKMYLVWWAKSRGMMPLNLSTTSLMLSADISKRMLSSKKRSIQWLWIRSRLRMKNCGTLFAWDLERFILNSTAILSLMICSVCSRTVAARRK